jgi:cation transport regulator ChaB
LKQIPEEVDRMEAEAHRQLAVDLFNGTWELLDRTDRTPKDDERMVHRAHASRYHWEEVPAHQPFHRARGDWLLARVYTVLGRADEALRYARLCLHECETHNLVDWDIAYAHEAMARAAALAGDVDAFSRHHARARALGGLITEKEDRDLLFQDLATAPWFGMAPPA